MGQNMLEGFMTGKPVVPMPERTRAWSIYDTFQTSDGEQVFVGVVTDTQWKIFCDAFERRDLLDDPALKTNPQRVEARPRILPIVRELFSAMTKAELLAKCEALGLPFAPVTKPEDLFDDPHLKQSGGLADVTLMNGVKTQVPILPLEMNGRRFRTRLDLPVVGSHTGELLAALGYWASATRDLIARRIVAASETGS
jgi:crotonobetainyl-CoA:carnitine CoA-transferase CaiB-like acyl-CoA transferase